MTASINSSYHVVWSERVSSTGFINHYLKAFSSFEIVSGAVANERLLKYFNMHPEELDERILSFLKEHSDGDVLLWHDLRKGTFISLIKDLF